MAQAEKHAPPSDHRVFPGHSPLTRVIHYPRSRYRFSTPYTKRWTDPKGEE